MKKEIDVKFYEKAMKRCELESFKDVEDHDRLLIAIRALEKQIPKKVIPYTNNHNFIEYVARNGHLDKYYKYCTECGQKLRD